MSKEPIDEFVSSKKKPMSGEVKAIFQEIFANKPHLTNILKFRPPLN